MLPSTFDILSYDFKPAIGGQGIFTQELFAELDARRVKVRILAQGPTSVKRHIAFPPYLPRLKNTQHVASALTYFQLEAVIQQFGIEKLMVNSGPGGILLAKKPSVPTVVYSHLTYSQSIVLSPAANWKRVFLPWEKKTYEIADLVITNSASTLSEIISTYGIAEKKIRVLYPGVAGEPCLLPLEEREPLTLIFVGRLVTRKGIVHLLDSFQELKHSYPSLRLTIVGEGPQRRMIERWMNKNLLHNSVSLLGSVTKPEVLNLLRKSFVTVVPSYFEGFGLVAAESLRVGTPVVASNVAGLREIVQDGNNGLLIPAGDSRALTASLKQLLEDSLLWRKLAAETVPSSMRFSWSSFCLELVEIMNSL